MYFNFFKARERRVNSPFFFFIVLIIFGFLFLIPNVIAVKPTQTSDVGGLQIAYPNYDYIPQDVGFTLYIHVYNTTDYITGDAGDCYLDLYNSQGVETISEELSQGGSDYYIAIDKGNFSMLGIDSFIIQCNTTNQVGFANGVFEVTESGRGDIDYFWILVVLIIFAYGIVIYGETRNEFPPIIMGAMLLIILSLYIWMNGIGTFEESNIISQLVAGTNFVIGASLILRTLWEAT